MVTEKFDYLSLQLSDRISDIQVTNPAVDGYLMTKIEREDYLNRAMNLMIQKYWAMAKGDSKQFLELFPELAAIRTFDTDANSQYVFASPNLDYFKVVEVVIAGILCSVVNPSFAKTTLYGIPQRRGSAAFPKSVTIEGTLTIYPVNSFKNLTSGEMTIIKRPVEPATGESLTTSGTTDVPFFPIWFSEIIDTAEIIYKKDLQEIDNAG